ncbi:MAG: hypothetical protein NTX61_07195 [Bacteroidetes bacterium]|nr:hypothetical protein [Bacteroidota bacterium]
MKSARNLLTGICIAVLFPAFSQTTYHTALEQPKCLREGNVRVNLFSYLSQNDKLKNEPWVVFSDRDPDFGTMYYVVNEDKNDVNFLWICKAKSHHKLELDDPTTTEKRHKGTLLVNLSADLPKNSMIHRKCVVLNDESILNKFKKKELLESMIYLYQSPSSKDSVGLLPLYYLYFIYKFENGRYLLGRNFQIPDVSFKNQILGWVDKERVYEYDSRICFEPNYDIKATKERRSSPEFAANPFRYKVDLNNFISNPTPNAKPILFEPRYYYLNGCSDTTESSVIDALLAKACKESGSSNSSSYLNNNPLDGGIFRYPLIELDDEDTNTFMMGVAGKFENRALLSGLRCKELLKNHKKLNVFLILDKTIPAYKSTFVINQIEQDENFEKKYGICFFPRVKGVKFKISLGESGDTSPNFDYAVDFVDGFNSLQGDIFPGDNWLKTLDWILDNEKFEIRQTNLILLLNNSPVINDETLCSHVAGKLARNNCAVVAFDYSHSKEFFNQFTGILVQASDSLDKIVLHSQHNYNASFQTIGNYFKLNGRLYSTLAQLQPGLNPPRQVVNFFSFENTTYRRHIDSIIKYVCEKENTISKSRTEAVFNNPSDETVLKLIDMNLEIPIVRYLTKGFSVIKYPQKSEPLWRAEVIMNRDELKFIVSQLDQFKINKDNKTESQLVYELWLNLYNRFVGDNLDLKSIIDKKPIEIMVSMIGSKFGYSMTDVIKRYSLRRIQTNDEEIKEAVKLYKPRLLDCDSKLNDIMFGNHLIFTLEDEEIFFKKAQKGSNPFYYWIPIDVLP